MCIVGYLEGTDPLFLSRLVAKGYDTMPISNGADNHGKYIGLVTKNDGIGVIVGYFHKIVPPADMNLTCSDILYSAKLHKIPVVLIAPEDVHEEAKKILGDAASDLVILTNQENLWEATMQFIKDKNHK